MVKNPLLKYSVEALLHEANPKGEPYFRRTYFYKSLFLLQDNLKKKDIDIQLPYCWYLHGPLIEPVSFKEKTGTNLEKYITNNSTVPIINVYEENVTDKEKNIILKEIRLILKKYKTGPIWNEDYGDPLVGESYHRAPYQYQVTFKREYLPSFNNLEREPDLYQYAFNNISQNFIKILDRLIIQFPEKDMSEILDEYLFWDEITRLKIDNAEPFYDIKECSNIYWGFFCKLLRIIQNENILSSVVEKWENEFKINQPIFNETLDNLQKDSFVIMNQKNDFAIDPAIDTIVQRLMGYARNTATQYKKEI